MPVLRSLFCAVGFAGFLYLAFLHNKPKIDALISIEIATLLKKANEFDGSVVTVTGVVLHSAAILGHGTYRLRQGDSEVWVLTGHGVPDPGSQTTVTGRFRQAVRLGTMQVAVLIDD